MGFSLKKAFGGVGAALGIVAAPFTGGASLALTGASLGSSLLKKTKKGLSSGAVVNTTEAESIVDRSAENAKKARARLLSTSGGILGEEIEDIKNKSGRNILGN